jgi:hypothetical protein
LELQPGSTYPEAVYEVDREAPEAATLGGNDDSPTKKAGISKRWIWVIIAILLMIVAAVGGGVGGAIAAKYKKSVSKASVSTSTSSPAPTPSSTSSPTSSSALISYAILTPRIQIQTGTSISSINWGAGPSYQVKVYFQGNDSFIYEPSFPAAGNRSTSFPKRLVQAKSLTPIASMFYPSDGTGNVSVIMDLLERRNKKR